VLDLGISVCICVVWQTNSL